MAKPNTSLPVCIWSEIGIKYNPDECLIPNDTNKRTHPPTITKSEEECLKNFIIYILYTIISYLLHLSLMAFTIVYLIVLVLLLTLFARKQIKGIESTKKFDEKAMLVLWLILGFVGLVTGGL